MRPVYQSGREEKMTICIKKFVGMRKRWLPPVLILLLAVSGKKKFWVSFSFSYFQNMQVLVFKLKVTYYRIYSKREFMHVYFLSRARFNNDKSATRRKISRKFASRKKSAFSVKGFRVNGFLHVLVRWILLLQSEQVCDGLCLSAACTASLIPSPIFFFFFTFA